jgi:23S rRNA pseudouridine1911/1915/1917 synthase
LVNALLHQVKDLAGIGGDLRPGIVHRLDKETSGCLVVAKNEKALVGLQNAFKSRTVEKVYSALVLGNLKSVEGRIETLYGRHPVDRKRFTGRVKEGKSAVTSYEVREQFETADWVEISLLTGRTHQIRVHFSEMGHPLIGDSLYGKGRKLSPKAESARRAIGRQALHAERLSFIHPRTGKKVTFDSPLPADFKAAIDVLGSRGTP